MRDRSHEAAPYDCAASNFPERLDPDRPDRPAQRAELGQFFTPAGVARFMASMLQAREPPVDCKLLDPGGGAGVLTAAAVEELCGRPERSRPAALHATVWELDARLADGLGRTFERCHAVCAKAGVAFRGEQRRGNFVLDAAAWADDRNLLDPDRRPRFHVAIMNPPYRKLRTDSAERARLTARGGGPAAFERRCIPPDCVVRRLRMPNMRPPHALSAGRLTALGATRDSTTGC